MLSKIFLFLIMCNFYYALMNSLACFKKFSKFPPRQTIRMIAKDSTSASEKVAIVVIDHGSRLLEANENLEKVISKY